MGSVVEKQLGAGTGVGRSLIMRASDVAVATGRPGVGLRIGTEVDLGTGDAFRMAEVGNGVPKASDAVG